MTTDTTLSYLCSPFYWAQNNNNNVQLYFWYQQQVCNKILLILNVCNAKNINRNVSQSWVSCPFPQHSDTAYISHHTGENEEVDEDEIRQCGIKLWQNVLLGFHLWFWYCVWRACCWGVEWGEGSFWWTIMLKVSVHDSACYNCNHSSRN